MTRHLDGPDPMNPGTRVNVVVERTTSAQELPMSADIPATREEAEALVAKLAFGVDEIRDADANALLALARIGIDWLYPTEEVRERVARAINDTGLIWQSEMLDRDALLSRADAAIAALTGGKP